LLQIQIHSLITLFKNILLKLIRFKSKPKAPKPTLAFSIQMTTMNLTRTELLLTKPMTICKSLRKAVGQGKNSINSQAFLFPKDKRLSLST